MSPCVGIRDGRVQPFDARGDLDPGIVLIEASAGTGKTHAISSLFVRFIAEKGVGVDQVLVVTYTVAATAELRERLRRRIRQVVLALEDGEDRALAAEDEVVAHLVGLPDRREVLLRLRTALAAMDEASIVTIHGFCERVLQRHALESGVDFEATVAEDAELLVEEVVGDVYLREMDRQEGWLVKQLKRTGFFEKLSQVALRIADDPDAELPVTPAPEPSVPNPAATIAAWEAARDEWERSHVEAVHQVSEASKQGRMHANKYRVKEIPDLVASVSSWFSKGPEEALSPPASLTKFGRRALEQGTKNHQVVPEHRLYDRIQAYLDAFGSWKESLKAYQCWLLRRMLEEIRKELGRRKRDSRVWSFHDLLVLVREALRHEEQGRVLREALRRRYRVALMDEFQDTDCVQWEVFQTLFDTKEHYLYLIGDPKQAIYSFRGADVYAYLRARESAHRRYTLTKNWRSDGRLVEAINTLYGRARRPFLLEELDYVPVDVPDQHRNDRLRFEGGQRAPLEIRFLPESSFEAAGLSDVKKPTLWKWVPIIVAADVSRLLEERPVVIGSDGSSRVLRPRDIAVLVRKHEQAWAVQRALRAWRIPSVLHSEQSVFQSEAAREMVSVLAAVVDPDDRLAVRTALATSWMGVSLSEVARREQDERTWEQTIMLWKGWRDIWREHGFSRMFRAVLHESSGAVRLAALEDGERRLTDLLHLAELLQAAESERDLGPEALLAWLVRERMSPTLDSERRQLRLESDEDAVRVVTMHHAKGLEFEVVFCPYLWDGRLREETQDIQRYHGPDGRLHYRLKEFESSEEVWKAAKNAAIREVFAEQLRLAYVALTRARHRSVVYWVPVTEHEKSALAWLLHGPCEEDSIVSGAKGLDENALFAAVRGLAEDSNGTIAVTRVVLPASGSPYEPREEDRVTEIAPASFIRQDLDTAWQRTSFSGWVRGHDEHGSGADEGGWRGLTSYPERGEVLLEGFPRGRVGGRCLHALFERLGPGSEDSMTLIREVLAEFGLDADRLGATVSEAVRMVLDTPLPSVVGGVRLRDVPVQDRLTELEFLFPVGGGLRGDGCAVSSEVLARILESEGSEVARRYAAELRTLRTPSVRGFISGQMDLAFRVGRTWHLLDYKSNHLGPSRSDYGPKRLQDEMVHSHYVLQYHLYAVALYRFLTLRVSDFDWDRDFGGVFYVFVRGLGDAGRTGVFADRPSGRLVRALSEVFGDGARLEGHGGGMDHRGAMGR